MQVTAHFDNIHQEILKVLNAAKYNIYVAVAWITDQDIWNVLIEKAKEGITVKIVLVEDDINKNENFDVSTFINSGGQLYWDDHHHKFCVVDIKTVITGSYNWTYRAKGRSKRENVVIIKDNQDLCEFFSDEFNCLLKESKKQVLPKEREIVIVKEEVVKEVIREVEVPTEVILDLSNKKDQYKIIESDRTPEHIGIFQGSFVLCAVCRIKLLQDNKCPKCKRMYIYNHYFNQYESYV
jgi:phosphatidylserine/phosphatidylglycerophosphate/cardiolipin synthase-like enzyme